MWNEGPPFGDFQPFFGATEATGGGFSVVFDEPPYQKGTIHGGHQRGVPDVAYNAAILHGVLTYLDIPGVADWLLSPSVAPVPVPRSGQPSLRLRIRRRASGSDSSIRPSTTSASTANQTSFHDITSGTNSAVEFDSSNNPVTVIGFSAGIGWDATTGFGSPISTSVVDALIAGVSPGDARSAIATTRPHPRPIVPGHMKPH